MYIHEDTTLSCVHVCRWTIGNLPGRHVVLGLRLAELANSVSHPFSVDIPAACLPRPWTWPGTRPLVVSLGLLKQKREREQR